MREKRKADSVPLTDTQRRVLKFLGNYLSENGYPPSRQDVCKEFGYASLNAAQTVLTALQKKGWIKLIPNVSRGIRVIR